MTARFGNLAGLPALGLKGAKPTPQQRDTGKRPDYLAAVRDLPCCICEAWGFPQTTPTEAHHTICGRYGQRKTPDLQAIPLCRAHHTTGEGGFLAIHRSKEAWVLAYGKDTDFIALTQDLVEKSCR